MQTDNIASMEITKKDAVIAGLRQRARNLVYQLEIRDRDGILYEEEIERLKGVVDIRQDTIRWCDAEIAQLKRSLHIADQEVHRLIDVITEQAAEIRGLQEEASAYRNEINEYQERVKYLETFISAGEGI